MFTDNITHFHNSLNFKTARVNPFTHDSTDQISSVSVTRSLSNSMIVENHFNKPLETLNHSSSIEDLTIAIKECKQKILKLMDNEEAKNKHIIQLIELNQTLHTVKEIKKTETQSETIEFIRGLPETNLKSVDIAGHFLNKSRQGIGKRQYCEICQGPIRTGRSVYKCQSCLVHVHSANECLQKLHRVCPASNLGHPSLFSSQIINTRRYSSANDDFHINIDLFPLSGNLLSQKFLCAECNFPIIPLSINCPTNFQRSRSIFCNYFRKYYCTACHWDNVFYIPAVYFMLNNWKKLPVCRSAYIKLKFTWNLVLFRIPQFWERNNLYAKEVLMIRLKMFRLRLFINECKSLKNLTKNYDDWLIEQPYLVTMKFVRNISNGSASKTVQLLYSMIIHCKITQTSKSSDSKNETKPNNPEKQIKSNVRSHSIGPTGGINDRVVLMSLHTQTTLDATELSTLASRTNPISRNNPTSRACYFCWCCCCSCSCLNIKPKLEEPLRTQISNDPQSKLEAISSDEKITLDEAQKWCHNFDLLMQSSAGRKVFHEFLKLEYSEENIMFYRAVEELQNETNTDLIEEKARAIYEDYISILSPKEVSLDSRVRELINSQMVEPSSHTFDEAQLQIFTLMQRDSYPRFLNSRLYKDFLHQLGGSSTTSNSQSIADSRPNNSS